MRKINKKKNPPKTLKLFNRQLTNEQLENPNFNTYLHLYDNDRTAFSDLQKALVAEQGGICCYCQRRISAQPGGVQVEHFKPKSIYNGHKKQPDLRTEYSNLLGACMGKVKDDQENQTISFCGQTKGDTEFVFLTNPADRNFDIEFRFIESTGKVIAKTTDEKINQKIQEELDGDKGLNINDQWLRKHRTYIYKGVTRTISKKSGVESNWDDKLSEVLPIVKDILSEYEKKDRMQNYKEFCDFVIYCLKKRFRGKL